MEDINDIQFYEGTLHTVEITIPDSFLMTGKKAKVQLRSYPSQPVKMEFSTESDDGNFIINGQKIEWIIPGSMSLGKAGIWNWQLLIWSDDVDPVCSDIFQFIIEPSNTKK